MESKTHGTYVSSNRKQNIVQRAYCTREGRERQADSDDGEPTVGSLHLGVAKTDSSRAWLVVHKKIFYHKKLFSGSTLIRGEKQKYYN